MSPFNLDEYEPVEDRLRAFWSEFPEGRVFTDLKHAGADGYIVFAAVWSDRLEEHPVATGYAQEAVTERGVNATSALENCETSAIGRALANLGYAAKGKRPSREEMTKASRGGAKGKGYGEGPASTSPRETSASVPATVIDVPTPPPAQATALAGDAEVQAGGESSSEAPASAEAAPGGPGAAEDGANRPAPRRRYPNAANRCNHEYPATEDEKCSGCGKPLAKIEATG